MNWLRTCTGLDDIQLRHLGSAEQLEERGAPRLARLAAGIGGLAVGAARPLIEPIVEISFVDLVDVVFDLFGFVHSLIGYDDSFTMRFQEIMDPAPFEPPRK